MKNLRSAFFLGVGSCLAIVACSSKSGQEDNNGSPSSGFNPDSGITGPNAQDTVNGTEPITADQAGKLQGCTQSTSTPTGANPPILEFVIDASGSMSSDPADPVNDPNGPSKWDVFSQTLPTVFASLSPTFAIGLTYFNLSSSGRGGGTYTGRQAVPIAPLDAAQLTALDNSVTAETPGGYTPTYCAWEFGKTTLTGWQAPAAYVGSTLNMVLITDGIPTVTSNCSTIQNPISQTEYNAEIYGNGTIAGIQADGKAANVKTFVVGVVGSENPQGATYDPLFMLSELAVAGGTAPGCTPVTGTPSGNTVNPRGTYCHIDLSQASNLSTALSQAIGNIAQSVLSCTYSVPPSANGQPVDPTKTVLEFTDGSGNISLILQNTSATCDKGWHFTDATRTQIEICGATCSLIQSTPNASLQLIFGCVAGAIVN